ncbi:MAG TPA: hypothetical protein VFG83_04835 [Kofleriaceae bacterium]|nr:hypothetical protein [Kofleriaceae bacterium]
MHVSRIAALAVVSVLVGCSPYEEQAPAPKKNDKPSQVIKVKTPVPYGKKVACADLLDTAKLGAALGSEVSLEDRSGSEAKASSVCGVMLNGEAPGEAAQKRNFKDDMKLGVLPGDEICTISAYCAFPTDTEDFKKRCQKAGDALNEALGQWACVHQTQRAAEWAYTYKTIDPDTKCTLKVYGGPSVTDEKLVQTCTRAALDTITPESITKYH